METNTTTTNTTTTYAVWVSDGTEVDEHGTLAAILDIHVDDEIATPAAWTSEQVDATDLIDEVSGRLGYGWEDRADTQVAEAKAEAERIAGQPIRWTTSVDDDGMTIHRGEA